MMTNFFGNTAGAPKGLCCGSGGGGRGHAVQCMRVVLACHHQSCAVSARATGRLNARISAPWIWCSDAGGPAILRPLIDPRSQERSTVRLRACRAGAKLQFVFGAGRDTLWHSAFRRRPISILKRSYGHAGRPSLSACGRLLPRGRLRRLVRTQPLTDSIRAEAGMLIAEPDQVLRSGSAVGESDSGTQGTKWDQTRTRPAAQNWSLRSAARNVTSRMGRALAAAFQK